MSGPKFPYKITKEKLDNIIQIFWDVREICYNHNIAITLVNAMEKMLEGGSGYYCWLSNYVFRPKRLYKNYYCAFTVLYMCLYNEIVKHGISVPENIARPTELTDEIYQAVLEHIEPRILDQMHKLRANTEYGK
jgi:hypothetical protein